MNRVQLQQLAQDRIDDATALFAAHRWSGAYHLAGYALECGLKSCVLAHLERTGMIFQDRVYLKNLGDCWTHDLGRLLELAGLKENLGTEVAANHDLRANWQMAKDWTEISRYERKTQVEAEELYKAITNEPDGVLQWIRKSW